MTSISRMFFRNFNTPLSKLISIKLRMPSVEFFRRYSYDEQQNKPTLKHGHFAEFYEKTKENKQEVEQDEDFEVLLRNSNFINVI